MNPLSMLMRARLCRFANRRLAVFALHVALLAGMTEASVRAGGVTREIHDGSGSVRTISIDTNDLVVLRNFAVGQPLRMSYCLNFPAAHAEEVRAVLEDCASVAAGGPAKAKKAARIGATQVKFSGSADSAVLLLSSGGRSYQMTANDAQALLKCLALLPAMKSERKGSEGRLEAVAEASR